MLTEAAIVGAISSVIGIGLGVLAAFGLKELLSAFGIDLPSGPLVFEARTVLVSLAVGVGVTVIASVGPARRAVRIPPVAALSRPSGRDGGHAPAPAHPGCARSALLVASCWPSG